MVWHQAARRRSRSQTRAANQRVDINSVVLYPRGVLGTVMVRRW
ncbi:MAG TPA: hypothetical protein VI542_02145 [Candidatus Tectomicrobia bacterium]